jgi:hypothetical protein
MIKGGSLSLEALELLSNPEKLEKRVSKLKQAEDNARAAVALVGPAEEVAQLRSKAEIELHTQRLATETAQKEAAQLVAQAREQAELTLVSARKEADRIVKEAAAQLAAVERELLAARTEHDSASRRASELTTAQTETARLQAEASSKINECDAQLLKLLGERRRLEDARKKIAEELAR